MEKIKKVAKEIADRGSTFALHTGVSLLEYALGSVIALFGGCKYYRDFYVRIHSIDFEKEKKD